MKMGRSSFMMKRRFGRFLKSNRLQAGWSVYDVGYMLKKTHATAHYWEEGFSFPASIVLLKKLCLLYGGIPETIKNIASDILSKVTCKDWKEFLKTIDEGHFVPPINDKLACNYGSVDGRDSEYKIAFGSYLRRERLDRKISASALARAFGVYPSNYTAWEAGSTFPQDVMVLVLLDKLYGNTFDVIFGLCKKNGIHLSHEETKAVLERKSEFAGTKRWDDGKSKPEGWQRYLDGRKKGIKT